MSHRLVPGVLVAAIVVLAGATPIVSSALTADDAQAQIQKLLLQVHELARQLNELRARLGHIPTATSTPVLKEVEVKPVVRPPHRICDILYRNLSPGTQGDDVQGLQEFLSTEGHFSANATGYFGPLTAQAVAKWQTEQGVPSVGIVGPMTRERIKVWCGGGQTACTAEYAPVCGSKPIVCITTPCNPVQQTYGNRCMMKADGATLLYEGSCRPDSANPEKDPLCKSWYDGCNTCSRSKPGGPAMCTMRACMAGSTSSPQANSMTKAYCTAYFDKNTAYNKPPVISGISGPTILRLKETGTWTIKASDPENDPLSYSITWGDEYAWNAAPAVSASMLPAFTQSTTFTHAYTTAGAYKVIAVVRDTTGHEARASITVGVTEGAPAACTLQYDPVCGRPQGCANTCPPGMYCTAMCRMPDPVTYSNRCFMEAAQATLISEGVCVATAQQ